MFNLCESLSGDARFEPLLPMLLEHAGIAYTGSPPLALGLALHKQKAKGVLRGAGVPTPDAVCLTTADVSAVTLPFPLIVKPSREDASTGISSQSVVHERADLERQVGRRDQALPSARAGRTLHRRARDLRVDARAP